MRLTIFLLLLTGFARAADPGPSPSAAPPERPLDPLLEADALWETPAQSSPHYANLGFHWNSAAMDSLQTTLPGVSLFHIPISGALVRFAAGKPKEVDVLFYDRGDNGELSKEEFDALLQRCEAAISAFSNAAMTPLGKDAASAVKADANEWQTQKTKFLLEFSSTRELKSRGIPFRAEFVRLEMTPVEKPRTLLDEALGTTGSGPFSGPSHVKKTASGDVLIEGIPMVDQGRKGYCVVASVERVLRYYGGKVDQNELAEIANSSAAKGTNYEEMFDALKKLTARLQIKTRVEEPFDSRTFLTIVTEYNRAAKKEKADQVDIYEPDSDIGSVYHQMNFDILRKARTKNPAEMDRFQKLVQAHIDDGIPLLWSVIVGLAPENPPIHGFGGHMRLVIGYNEQNAEILYSDSWGPGHELKRMPAADAWAITTGISTVEPL